MKLILSITLYYLTLTLIKITSIVGDNEVDGITSPSLKITEKISQKTSKGSYMCPIDLNDDVESNTCRLYMAESSIANAGIGIYAGVSVKEGDIIGSPDIVINIFDHPHSFKMAQLFTEDESLQWKEIVGNKIDSYDEETYQGRCVNWARKGECDSNPNFMLKNCEKSCAVALNGMDLDKVLSSKEDTYSHGEGHECQMWAERLCRSNPEFMLAHCADSCTKKLYNLKVSSQEMQKWNINNYFWHENTSLSSIEADFVDSFISGTGALANSHPSLFNICLVPSSADSIIYDRLVDPGVGASSDRLMQSAASKDIPAGMELFENYGDHWLVSREDEIGRVPLDDDYHQADMIIRKFWKEVTFDDRDIFTVPSDDPQYIQAKKLYDATKKSITDTKVRECMPDTIEKAKEAVDKGTAMFSLARRSQEWLLKHGFCLDNIRQDISTILQAGRGAFATRNCKEGQTIAPMPLIPVERNRLRHFVGDIEMNKQLILNYSYGHRQSSLLLIPYSSIVNFINNNIDKSKVNAKVEWSSTKFHQSTLESKTVEYLLNRTNVKLMLEIVATRDIEKGEEIFIDYGSNWDKAWMKHMNAWNTGLHNTADTRFTSAHRYNTEEKIKTVAEQVQEPYPINVKIMCVVSLNGVSFENGNMRFNWNDHSVESKCARDQPFSHRCQVLKRYKGKMKNGSDFCEETTLYEISIEWKNIISFYDVPRMALHFANEKYTSDQHYPNSFRHEISIPDDIFPEKWMDLEDSG